MKSIRMSVLTTENTKTDMNCVRVKVKLSWIRLMIHWCILTVGKWNSVIGSSAYKVIHTGKWINQIILVTLNPGDRVHHHYVFHAEFQCSRLQFCMDLICQTVLLSCFLAWNIILAVIRLRKIMIKHQKYGFSNFLQRLVSICQLTLYVAPSVTKRTIACSETAGLLLE